MTAARGRLFVIAAPSGAGKTSLVHALMQREPRLRFSISYTTRAPRPNEQPGRDYFFVSKEEFQRMIAEGAFLEHANVFDNYYGTSKSQVEQMLEQGDNVLLEIDWQGARQVRAAMPDCASIFILPPSREALEARLRGRATDSDQVIARRLRDSIADMSHWNEFAYVVINDDFERALHDLHSIVRGEGAHLKAQRAEVQQLVKRLLQ
jgi:guanylate kinase